MIALIALALGVSPVSQIANGSEYVQPALNGQFVSKFHFVTGLEDVAVADATDDPYSLFPPKEGLEVFWGNPQAALESPFLVRNGSEKGRVVMDLFRPIRKMSSRREVKSGDPAGCRTLVPEIDLNLGLRPIILNAADMDGLQKDVRPFSTLEPAIGLQACDGGDCGQHDRNSQSDSLSDSQGELRPSLPVEAGFGSVGRAPLGAKVAILACVGIIAWIAIISGIFSLLAAIAGWGYRWLLGAPLTLIGGAGIWLMLRCSA